MLWLRSNLKLGFVNGCRDKACYLLMPSFYGVDWVGPSIMYGASDTLTQEVNDLTAVVPPVAHITTSPDTSTPPAIRKATDPQSLYRQERVLLCHGGYTGGML